MMRRSQIEVVEAVVKLNRENGFARTPDVAAELGVRRNVAWHRLDRLAKRGLLVKHTATYPQTDVVVTYWSPFESG